MRPTYDKPVTVAYKGYEITKNIDECGEMVIYVETPSGPSDVASMRAARSMIDTLVQEDRQLRNAAIARAQIAAAPSK